MNLAARKAVDNSMTLQERAKIALQSFGTQTVHISMDDFAAKMGVERMSAYQAIHRMEQKREIEVLTEPIGDTGRKRICGFRIFKAEPTDQILTRALTKMEGTVTKDVNRHVKNLREQIPNLMSYAEKKVVLDNIREQLASLGFNPTETLVLPTDNILAEEGILVYNAWLESQRELDSMRVQMEITSRGLRATHDEITQEQPITIS